MIPSDIVRKVENLRPLTMTRIRQHELGLIPEFIQTKWRLVDSYQFSDTRYFRNPGELIFAVSDIRFTLGNKKKRDVVFNDLLIDCVDLKKVYPMAVFVNGLFMKWSKVRIVRDFKYSYVIVNMDIKYDDVSSFEMLHIPFRVHYSENRKYDFNHTQIMRFNEFGLLDNTGKTVFTTPNKNILYRNVNYTNTPILKEEISIDHEYQLTPDNVIVFANGRLDRDLAVEVQAMNILTIGGGEYMCDNLTYKAFYSIEANKNVNNVNITRNISYVKDLIRRRIEVPALDLVRFTKFFDSINYSPFTNYQTNLNNAIERVMKYNPGLLNSVYQERSNVRTVVYSGAELKTKLNEHGHLQMLRLKYKHNETFVMMFVNGELYARYNTIKYGLNTFNIQAYDLNDEDTIELVFFTNVNNNVVTTTYNHGKITIEEDPFDLEDLEVLCNESTKEFVYPLAKAESTLYKSDFSLSDKELVMDDFYIDKQVSIVSKHQFRYFYNKTKEDSFKLSLPYFFNTCTNRNSYMVFRNGRLLSKDMFELLVPDYDNPFPETFIYSKKMFKAGDRVEVFYLPIDYRYLDLSNDTQVKVLRTRSVSDGQSTIEMPIEFDNFSDAENNFFVIINGVFINPTRYEIIDGYLVFTDPKDYLKANQDVFFVVMIASANFENVTQIENLGEKDFMNIETKEVVVETEGQTVFDIPFPKENFFEIGGTFLLSNRGLFIQEDSYEVKDNQLIMKDDRLELGTVLSFTFMYSEMEVKYLKYDLLADFEGKKEFDLQIPYENYLIAKNKFMVFQNGILLSESGYVVMRKTNKLYITSLDGGGLTEGTKLTIIMPYMTTEFLDVRHIKVVATKDNQTVFDIPLNISDKYDKDKFFVTIHSTFVSDFLFDVTTSKLYLKDDGVQYGDSLDFIYISKKPEIFETSIKGDAKYTKFITMNIPIEETGRRTFTIPMENCAFRDIEFFVSVGTTFLFDNSFDVDKLNNTINFKTDMGLEKGREITFTFILNTFSNVIKEEVELIATEEKQTVFDLPIPYGSFFELGNEFLLFIGNTFIDPMNYVIDKKNLKITLTEHVVEKGRKITYLFLYTPSKNNIPSLNPNTYTTLIKEYGYLFVGSNKSDMGLKYPRAKKKTYFLFINGKKIDVDSIIDLSNNILRINRDPQTRYNVCLLDYTEHIPELEVGSNIVSDLDSVVNNLSTVILDLILDLSITISDTEPKIIEDIPYDILVNEIVREFFAAPGFITGNPYWYTYEKAFYPNRDDGENIIIPLFDPTKKTTFEE